MTIEERIREEIRAEEYEQYPCVHRHFGLCLFHCDEVRNCITAKYCEMREEE